jgi:Tol biopolymer transport system component
VATENYFVTISDGLGAVSVDTVVITITGAEEPLVNVTNTAVDEFLSDISADGRYVTYTIGDVGSFDVFWKDIQTGEVKTSGGPGDQANSHISGDGQHVTFTSDTGVPQVVAWDVGTDTVTTVPTGGVAAVLSDISVDGVHVTGTQLSGAGSQIFEWDLGTGDFTLAGTSTKASNPAISGDGSYVVYQDRSFSTNPSETEIVVTEVATGTSIRVTDNALQGTQVMDINPAISADGNFIAIQSCETTGTNCDIFLFDRVAGGLTNVSASVAGENVKPDVSGDGRFVVFQNTNAGETDIFVWDRTTGDVASIALPGDQRGPSISADGHYILFESNETGAQYDVFRAVNPLFDDFVV